MERYALLHRIQSRRRVTQRMLMRLPLHAYIGRRRLLLQATERTQATERRSLVGAGAVVVGTGAPARGGTPYADAVVARTGAVAASTGVAETGATVAGTGVAGMGAVAAGTEVAGTGTVVVDGDIVVVGTGAPARGGTPYAGISILPKAMSGEMGLSNESLAPSRVSSASPALGGQLLAAQAQRISENAPQVAHMPSSMLPPVVEPTSIQQSAASVAPSSAQDESLYQQISTNSQPSTPSILSPMINNIADTSAQSIPASMINNIADTSTPSIPASMINNIADTSTPSIPASMIDDITNPSVQTPSHHRNDAVTEQQFAQPRVPAPNPIDTPNIQIGRDPVLPHPLSNHTPDFPIGHDTLLPHPLSSNTSHVQIVRDTLLPHPSSSDTSHIQTGNDTLLPHPSSSDTSRAQTGHDTLLPHPLSSDTSHAQIGHNLVLPHPLSSDTSYVQIGHNLVLPHPLSPDTSYVQIDHDTLPTGNDTLPIGNDTLPIVNDTLPTGNDTLPIGNDTLPTGNDTLPTGRDPVLPRPPSSHTSHAQIGNEPLARGKEKRRQRRSSKIEERPSSAGFVSPSTEATSAAQATTSKRLTPQETKAALAALVPSQDTPQSSSAWLALLQQSKWGNGNNSITTSISVPRTSPTPNAKFSTGDEYQQQSIVREPRTIATSGSASLIRDASRVAQYVPAADAPAPDQHPIMGAVPQAPAVPFVPPLPGPVPAIPVAPPLLGPVSATSVAPQRTSSAQPRPPSPAQKSDGHVAPIAALDPQTAEPVPQRARLFLRPLVGIDPAEVDLHRGAVATAIVNAYQADAIAVGDSILMAGKKSIDTPETLGLLAHELTHVARRRTTHTVPPIMANPLPSIYHAMPSAPTSYAAGGPLAAPAPTSPSMWPASRGEEYLAQEVEQRVIVQAQDTRQQNNRYPSHDGASTHTEQRGEPEETFAPTIEWGGLPAPWEPLPTWLTTPPAQEQSAAHQPSLASASVPTSMRSFKSELGEMPATHEVQRAATERTSGTIKPTDTKASQAQPELPAVPKPDMDLLAQQVYQLLKRRLAVERRRMQ